MSDAVKTREEALARLSIFKENRQREYDLISLGIFGSFARGQADDQSDVDVVFETRTPNLLRTSRMKRELEDLLVRRVDLVRLRERMNPRLKERILHEAKYVQLGIIGRSPERHFGSYRWRGRCLFPLQRGNRRRRMSCQQDG